MTNWIVKIRGEGFRVSFDDGIWPCGFFTTRFVEADSAELAEQRAIDLIRADSELGAATANAPDDSPMLYVTSLVEVADFAGLAPPGKGYSFYRATPTMDSAVPSDPASANVEIRTTRLVPLDFVPGGFGRDAASQAAEDELRQRVRAELMAEFAVALARAGWLRKKILLGRIEAEIQRRLVGRLFSSRGS